MNYVLPENSATRGGRMKRRANGRAAVNMKRLGLDGRHPPTLLKAPVSPGRGLSFSG